MNTCKDCFYWDSHVEGGYPYQLYISVDVNDKRTVTGGRCRRYAPHPNFGVTREDDWCGDYFPKTKIQEEIKAIESLDKFRDLLTDPLKPLGFNDP